MHVLDLLISPHQNLKMANLDRALVYAGFDCTQAEQMFIEYLDGKHTSEDMLVKMLPILGLVLNNSFENLDSFYWEDVVAAAAEKLWKAVNGKWYDPKQGSFLGFFYTIVKNVMITTIHKYQSPEYDFNFACRQYPAGRIPSTGDMDNKIAVENVIGKMEEVVGKHIRFTAKERRACVYILKQIIKDETVAVFVIRTLCPKSYRFLVDYVTVLCRIHLSSIRTEHHKYAVDYASFNPVHVEVDTEDEESTL